MTCACKLQGGYSGRAEAMGKDAAERLALLLCQEGRDKEAAKILKNHGFRYRLSRRVLRYQLSRAQPLSLLAAQDASREQHTVKSSERSCLPSEDLAFEAADGRGARMVEEASEFVVAVDSALPVVMLQHLQVMTRQGKGGGSVRMGLPRMRLEKEDGWKCVIAP